MLALRTRVDPQTPQPMESAMKKILMAVAVVAVAVLAADSFSSAVAEPSEPRSQAGKCAKAAGGLYDADRKGWYPKSGHPWDRVAYQTCVSRPATKATKAAASATQKWRNARGEVVTIRRPTNFRECMKNGESMGYAQAQSQAHCVKQFPK